MTAEPLDFDPAPCAPADAAHRARWWRVYAARDDATDAERVERLRRAGVYQAMAQCGDVADSSDLSEAMDG